MNSVASTLNRVTDMEFNNEISVYTQNNWNTWKNDIQIILKHYGCKQFIIQTKPEQPDEGATYKEKLDLQLHKDRCYTLIYTNISPDLKNLITETTDGVTAWKILKDHFEPVTRARIIKLLDHFFGIRYQPREDVGIFISCVKTATTRLQEAGHKLDDLYIGFQLIRWLPQEFLSTVQQIYRWKEEDFGVVKIEAELILEANRLQLMKQDLEKAENAYLSSFTSKKTKTFPRATAAAHGDPNGKKYYQKKKVPDHYIIPKSKEIIFFSNVTAKTKNGSIEIWHRRFCHVNNDYSVKTSKNDSVRGLPRLTDNGKTHCIPCKLAKSKRVSFKKTGAVRSKRPLELLHMDLRGPMPTESQGGYKYFLSIIDDYSRKSKRFLVSKTSTETPSTSEKPVVSSDNHSLIPCTEVKWIRNIGRKVTGSNVYYSTEGEATRLKSFNEIEIYYLSEQQEALMVEVTIPNCYKQAIRSRDASKWHDAMDKEINVMKERKVWDFDDNPDNIKILDNRWVYSIKYDENNKIVRYKAHL
ncbi:retrovirus-related Pol polyprotein from transposon TNT 1-94 [Trichonephila clavipes]|nr:retrovirus-related Pol polyprotein from transposon TNT 1-94 [Trichonephila clavipes]